MKHHAYHKPILALHCHLFSCNDNLRLSSTVMLELIYQWSAALIHGYTFRRDGLLQCVAK